MASRSNQDYLKATYQFNEKGLPVRDYNIASRVGISPPSVMEMLKSLEGMEYIIYKPCKGALLTGRGWGEMEGVVWKPRLLERFLTDVLGLNNQRVHGQAVFQFTVFQMMRKPYAGALTIHIHDQPRGVDSTLFNGGLKLLGVYGYGEKKGQKGK